MLSTALPLVLAAAGPAVAIPRGLVPPRQAPCDDVHIFLARGSNEPYPGRQGALADLACSKATSSLGLTCGWESVVYPAAFDDYCGSQSAGVVNGTAQVAAYVAACPDVQVLLTGYSQGGQVVGDILGGSTGGTGMGCLQTPSEGLAPETAPGSNVAGAALFGDVRHVGGQSYNVGNGTENDGIWPREGEDLTSLNEFSDVLHSWCLDGDAVCYEGGNSNTAHTAYFEIYLEEASDWMVSMLE